MFLYLGTLEYLDLGMEWLSIQVVQEIEEEHPGLLFNYAGQQVRVRVQLLASRFTNNGFDKGQ
jgi:hypothetical protein